MPLGELPRPVTDQQELHRFIPRVHWGLLSPGPPTRGLGAVKPERATLRLRARASSRQLQQALTLAFGTDPLLLRFLLGRIVRGELELLDPCTVIRIVDPDRATRSAKPRSSSAPSPRRSRSTARRSSRSGGIDGDVRHHLRTHAAAA